MKRHARNPILTRSDIPDVSARVADVSSVFNPAAFKVQPRLLPIDGLDVERLGIFHVYDLRATPIDGEIHVVFAADTAGGCRLGVARLEGDRLQLIGFDERNDSRNGVTGP